MATRIIFPKTVIKKVRTSQFGSNPTSLASNEGIDIVPLIQNAIDDNTLTGLGGGSGANLTISTTSTTATIVSDTGTDAIIPSATTSQAGVLTAVDKQKLDVLTNYTHPNHTGEVTSLGDGSTIIGTNVVSNTKLADMPANTIKVRSGATPGDPQDLPINANQLVGRGQSGDISTIALGTNLSMSGNTLNATGGGGSTNLSEGTRTTTTVEVLSDTGTDATLSPATITQAGVMSAGDKVNTVSLITLSGVAADSTNLGTFTGTTIADNATNKVALQALETALEAGDTVSNGLSGNGRSATPHKLGGTLTENTTIEGADFNLNVVNAGTIQFESDSTTRTHRTELAMFGDNTFGGYFRHVNKSNANQVAQLLLDHDTTMGLTYGVSAGQTIGFRIAPNTTTALSKLLVDTPNKAIGTATTGQVLTLQADGSTEFQAGGGSSITGYAVTVTGTANSTLQVVATGAGVTAVYAANRIDVTIPVGVTLLSADFIIGPADIQAAADGGGFTNWVLIGFSGTSGNTSMANIRIPNIQKGTLPIGAPSVSNTLTIDIDNNPSIGVVGVGSNAIVIRASGIATSVGIHLKMSNI